jgi:hypothetical protein
MALVVTRARAQIVAPCDRRADRRAAALGAIETPEGGSDAPDNGCGGGAAAEPAGDDGRYFRGEDGRWYLSRSRNHFTFSLFLSFSLSLFLSVSLALSLSLSPFPLHTAPPHRHARPPQVPPAVRLAGSRRGVPICRTRPAARAAARRAARVGWIPRDDARRGGGGGHAARAPRDRAGGRGGRGGRRGVGRVGGGGGGGGRGGEGGGRRGGGGGGGAGGGGPGVCGGVRGGSDARGAVPAREATAAALLRALQLPQLHAGHPLPTVAPTRVPTVHSLTTSRRASRARRRAASSGCGGCRSAGRCASGETSSSSSPSPRAPSSSTRPVPLEPFGNRPSLGALWKQMLHRTGLCSRSFCR